MAIMKKSLWIIFNIVTLIILGAGSEPLCPGGEEPVDPAVERQMLDGLYANADGLAIYQVPLVTLRTEKESFTLDWEKHLENALKAQYVTFPVSQAYYDEVELGQRIDSNFDEVSFLFDGEINSYVVTVSSKSYSAMYCIIENEDCTEIEQEIYEKLLAINAERQEMSNQGENLVLREDVVSLEQLHGESCRIELESYKTDLTIDLYAHFKNSLNTLSYEVEFPGFLCSEIEEGTILDSNFVGWSLLLSDSPSYVTYRVLKVLP